MKHFIITPFYVRRHFAAKTGKIEVRHASLEWLDDRLRLFEAYCLPSVAAQSNQNFSWYLYFDDSTPGKYLERVAAAIARSDNIFIKRCALWEGSTLVNDLVAGLDERTRWVITTRLDNDDGLQRDFVAMLHAAVEERTEFLNFPRGIIWYSGKCYVYRHPSNAFLSMVESADSPRTVWVVPHEEAARIAPVRQLSQTPAFLQVIHGNNLSNKPRGTRIDARRALIDFDAIDALQGAGERETSSGIMLENATRVLLWRFRDWLISMAKPLRR
jgi:Putative rhamnosyl transferase